MPFCPICRYEYREGIEVCPDCDAKLVPKLEPEHISRSLKKAYTTNSPAMAEMIQEMLEEEKIASVLSNELGSALIPVAGESTEIAILVPEEKTAEAQELIKVFFEENPDTGEFIVCSNCGARVESDLAACPFCGEAFEEKSE